MIDDTFIVTIKSKVKMNLEDSDETQEILDKLEQALELESNNEDNVKVIDYEIRDIT